MSDKEIETNLGSNNKEVNILSDINKEILLCSVWVEKINTRGGINKRFFVASEGNLSLYKNKPFSKDRILCKRFNWQDLLKISLSNSLKSESKTVELFFQNSKLQFEHKNGQEIAIILGKYSLSILCPNERPQINIPGFDPIDFVENPEPILNCGDSDFDSTEFLALMRFRSIMFSNGSQIPPSALQCFISYATSPTFEFDCTPMGADFHEVQDSLFFALQIDDSIESIKMPNNPSKSGNWKPFCKYISNNHTLRSITIGEQFNEEAESIIEAVKSNKKCCLKEMTFLKNNIKDFHLNMLVNILKELELDSLTFSGAMSRNVLKMLMNKIEKMEFFKKLKIFTIDAISDLYVLTAVNVCQNIPHVSFTNCEAEILGFIKAMMKVNVSGVETLDVSGNQSYIVVNQNLFLPNSLHMFTADNCSFAIHNVYRLIKAICNSKNEISVSMNNISIIGNNWRKVFDNFEQINATTALVELHWDNNQISGKFLEFLERNRCINLLTLNDLIIPYISDEKYESKRIKSIIEDLCDFIATNNSLSSISLNSTRKETQMTSSMLSRIISGLGDNRFLEKISLRGQKIDKVHIDQLSSALMNNRVLRVIDINDCDIDENDLLVLLQRIEDRGAPLNINFNLDMIEDGEKKRNISALRTKICRGDEDINIPEETITVHDYSRTPKYRMESKRSLQPKTNNTQESVFESQDEMKDAANTIFGEILPPISNREVIETLENRFSINEIVTRIRLSDNS